MIEYTRCPKCGTLFDVSDIDLSDSDGWVQCGECTQQFHGKDNAVERSELLGESILANMDDMSTPEQQGFNLDQLAIERTVNAEFESKSVEVSEMIDLFDGNPPSFVERQFVGDAEGAHSYESDYAATEYESYDDQVASRLDRSTEVIAQTVQEYYKEQSVSVDAETKDVDKPEIPLVRGFTDGDPDELTTQQSGFGLDEPTVGLDETTEQIDFGLEKPSEEKVVFAEADLENDIVNQQFDDVDDDLIVLDEPDPLLTEQDSDAELSVDDDVYASLQPAKSSSLLRALSFSVGLSLMLILGFVLAFQLQQRQLFTWMPEKYYDELNERWLSFLDRGQAPKADLSKLHLSSTRTEPHLTQPGARTLVLQLINRADINQAYPGLQVAFTDEAGKVIARRILQPYQYLEDDQLNMLESKQAKALRIHFSSLPENAVGYEVKVVN